MSLITILWGLPASGKTTYAQSIANRPTKVIDCDRLFKYRGQKQLHDMIIDWIDSYIHFNIDQIVYESLVDMNLIQGV